MTEKRFVERYAGRTIKKLIGIEDIETNRVCVTIEENIHLLNELADENKELKEENEQLKKENQMLKHTIGRNENYIARLTHKGEWKDTTKPLYRSISRGD